MDVTAGTPFIKLDPLGNIWINDAYSISKFDGTKWEINKRNDSTSLFYHIYTFSFDSSSHLWGVTWENQLIEVANNLRKYIKCDSLIDYLTNNPSYTLFDFEISKNGTKWLIINDNFTGRMKLIKYIDDLNFTIIEGNSDKYDFLPDQFNITMESDSSFWVGGNEYLRWYDGADSYRIYTFRNGIRDDCVDVVYIDEYGNKWLSVRDYYNSNDEHPTYIVVLNDNGVKLSVDKDPRIKQATIYPNPARDYIYINSSLIDGVGVWDYQIYDLLGNCVQRGIIESDKINISKLSTGFYTVRFFNGGKQVVKKMMKE